MKRNHRIAAVPGYLAIILSAYLTVPNSYAQRAGASGRRAPDADFEKAPVAKNQNEQRILQILADIQANQRYQNVPPNDGRLLRLLTESIGAKHVVEIGTSTGYSGIWIGLALQQTGGKLTTYEINAQRAATARANFKRAGMSEIVTLVEGDAHKEVGKLTGAIDLLFLDADKEGYLDYLNQLLPLVRPGGLVVGHNITPGMADPKFMEAITTNSDLDTVVRSGVSISLKKR